MLLCASKIKNFESYLFKELHLSPGGQFHYNNAHMQYTAILNDNFKMKNCDTVYFPYFCSKYTIDHGVSNE